MQPQPLDEITITGYKSIQSLWNFELDKINVLIGANGSGKSNFISFFRFINDIVQQRLELSVNKVGGADRLLFNGPKETDEIVGKVYFGLNGYEFTLIPTEDNRLIFKEEENYFNGPKFGPEKYFLGSGHSESKLPEKYNDATTGSVVDYVFSSVKDWTVYHFHDTSTSAKIRRQCSIRDNEILHPYAENLAAFLFMLKNEYRGNFHEIIQTIRIVAPFFKEFHFRPKQKGGDEYVELEWKEVNSNSIFYANQLSDGTLRFLAIVTALLQPNPPRTILFDEPELGLHPYALHIIAELMHSVCNKIQLIVSTQSVPFINLFDPDNIIVTDRTRGKSIFKRLNPDEFKVWIEDDYSLGQLWEKNIIGGSINYD